MDNELNNFADRVVQKEFVLEAIADIMVWQEFLETMDTSYMKLKERLIIRFIAHGLTESVISLMEKMGYNDDQSIESIMQYVSRLYFPEGEPDEDN